jgi:hypothetical protein
MGLCAGNVPNCFHVKTKFKPVETALFTSIAP